MKINFSTTARKLTLPMVMLSTFVILAGCDRPGQSVDSVGQNSVRGEHAGPDKPLGHVMEFDGYTLRANVSRADVLNDTMARRYGIAANPDLALLNLVIQDNNVARQEATVEAAVSVEHENLLGQTQVVDMRAIEADGYISYVGTLDASSQRIFQLIIKVRPEGTEQPLEMNFEVQLDW